MIDSAYQFDYYQYYFMKTKKILPKDVRAALSIERATMQRMGISPRMNETFIYIFEDTYWKPTVKGLYRDYLLNWCKDILTKQVVKAMPQDKQQKLQTLWHDNVNESFVASSDMVYAGLWAQVVYACGSEPELLFVIPEFVSGYVSMAEIK